jgi:hypothetical protein
MLDKTIYYETVMDDTPILSKYADSMKPLNIYESGTTYEEYIINKTKSIIYFLLYLKEIELHEKRVIIEKGKISENNYNTYFKLFDDQKLSIIKDNMKAYLFGFIIDLNDEELYDYKEDWYDSFKVPKEERR